MPHDQPAAPRMPLRLPPRRGALGLASARLLAQRREAGRRRDIFNMLYACINHLPLFRWPSRGRRATRRPSAGSAARKSRRNPLKRLKTGSETRSPPLSAASPRGGPGLAPGRRRGPENPPQALEIAQNRLGFGPRASRSVVARRPTTRRSGGPGSPDRPLDRHAPSGLAMTAQALAGPGAERPPRAPARKCRRKPLKRLKTGSGGALAWRRSRQGEAPARRRGHRSPGKTGAKP